MEAKNKIVIEEDFENLGMTFGKEGEPRIASLEVLMDSVSFGIQPSDVGEGKDFVFR